MAWENCGCRLLSLNSARVWMRRGISSPGITSPGRPCWGEAGPEAALPGNIVSGGLIGYEPAPFVPLSPAPDPTSYNNGNNHVPSPSMLPGAWAARTSAPAKFKASVC